MTIIVTIKECYGDHKTTTLCSRTDDLDTAIERAIRKGYGAGKVFCRDHGISVGLNALLGSLYGQIGHTSRRFSGISLDTGRVCIRAKQV